MNVAGGSGKVRSVPHAYDRTFSNQMPNSRWLEKGNVLRLEGCGRIAEGY